MPTKGYCYKFAPVLKGAFLHAQRDSWPHKSPSIFCGFIVLNCCLREFTLSKIPKHLQLHAAGSKSIVTRFALVLNSSKHLSALTSWQLVIQVCWYRLRPSSFVLICSLREFTLSVIANHSYLCELPLYKVVMTSCTKLKYGLTFDQIKQFID